ASPPPPPPADSVRALRDAERNALTGVPERDGVWRSTAHFITRQGGGRKADVGPPAATMPADRTGRPNLVQSGHANPREERGSSMSENLAGDRPTDVATEIATAVNSMGPTAREIVHTALEGLRDNAGARGYDDGREVDNVTQIVQDALSQ